MTKIESINAAAFAIDTVPHQRGSAAIITNGDLVSIVEAAHDERRYVDRVPFTDYRDGADAPFATLEALLIYLRNTIMI